MTVAINTYGDISSFVNTVWEDAMLVARENAILPGVVTVLTDVNGMAVRTNAKYGTAIINQVSETDDLTSQAFTPSTDQSLTPYEYGAQYFITDIRDASDIWANRQNASIELGRALGQDVDKKLISLFASLTAGTIDKAGSNMTWSAFYAALTVLRTALAPLPYVLVLHPYQWHSMGTAVVPGATVTNSPSIQDAILNRFFVANVSGVDIYTDANITSGTACKGAMFSRNAMALDWRRAPRIEPERDASRRGYELNLSAIYAYGVWRPQYGALLSTAGTAPTG